MAEEKKPENAVSPEYARALEAEKKDPTSISNLIDPRAMMVDQGYDWGVGREMLSLLPWLSQLDARDKPGERMIAPELAGMPADQAEEYMPAQAQVADYPPWLAGKAARERPRNLRALRTSRGPWVACTIWRPGANCSALTRERCAN